VSDKQLHLQYLNMKVVPVVKTIFRRQ
jgi:hypothetical protein